MSDKKERKESKSWVWALVLGSGFTLFASWDAWMNAFTVSPVNWGEAGRGVELLLNVGLPVVVVAAILWFRRYSKLPSIAFVVTFITACMFFIFSFSEFIGGMVENRSDFKIGGLAEILTFSAPLFAASWFLWTKPKIGSIILMLIGIGMGIWIITGWPFPEDVSDWVILGLLSGLPVILGLYTLIKEMVVAKPPDLTPQH